MCAEEWILEYSLKYQWLNVEKLSIIQKYEADNKELAEEMGFRTINVYPTREDAEKAAVIQVQKGYYELTAWNAQSVNNLRNKHRM